MSGPATTDTKVPSGFLSVTVRVGASIASTVAVSVLISELTVLVWAMAVRAIDTRNAAAIIPTTNRFMCPPSSALRRGLFTEPNRVPLGGRRQMQHPRLHAACRARRRLDGHIH